VVEDHQLIRQMRRGDQDALRLIYMRYKDDLLTIAGYLVSDLSAAEDCLHDVFVDFAAGIAGFTLRSSLKGYLATCVANRARDELRRRARRPASVTETTDPPAPEPEPPEILIDDEEGRKLWQVMAGLPEEQREVIVLHLHGDLMFREIAEHLAVSIHTVQSRYRYGLEKLRSSLTAGVET